MFDTDETLEVTLLCKESLMKVIVDNFGLKVDTTLIDEDHFEAKVMVCTNPTFCRWVFGFKGGIKILSPDTVKDEYRTMLQKTLDDLI